MIILYILLRKILNKTVSHLLQCLPLLNDPHVTSKYFINNYGSTRNTISDHYFHPSTSQYCVVIDNISVVPEKLPYLYLRYSQKCQYPQKTHFVSTRTDSSSVTNRKNSTLGVEISYGSSSRATLLQLLHTERCNFLIMYSDHESFSNVTSEIRSAEYGSLIQLPRRIHGNITKRIPLKYFCRCRET
jgi:hypothetical protein